MGGLDETLKINHQVLSQTCHVSAHPGDSGKKQRAGTIVDVRAMINDATRLNVEEGYEERSSGIRGISRGQEGMGEGLGSS
jgi:hypothetical protein